MPMAARKRPAMRSPGLSGHGWHSLLRRKYWFIVQSEHRVGSSHSHTPKMTGSPPSSGISVLTKHREHCSGWSAEHVSKELNPDRQSASTPRYSPVYGSLVTRQKLVVLRTSA